MIWFGLFRSRVLDGVPYANDLLQEYSQKKEGEGIRTGEERKARRGAENLFEEIIAENFPNLGK